MSKRSSRNARPVPMSRNPMLAQRRRTPRFEHLEDRRLLAIDLSLLKDINTAPMSSAPLHFVELDGIAYFTATNPTYGRELWRSDGSVEGTWIVKDVQPGSGDGLHEFFSTLTVVGDLLFFQASDGTHGPELWATDGTAVGTRLVKDIQSGPDGSQPNYLVDLNGTLLFTASDAAGSTLWKSDGTAEGTVLVKAVGSDPFSSVRYLKAVGGTLFFVGDDQVVGGELWKSDGTTEGTTLVKDIRPGRAATELENLTDVNGKLYFSANDGASGRELWKSDGTAAGTVMVKDIRPGLPSTISNSGATAFFTDLAGILYFVADDGVAGSELWKSDGTESGTVLVKDIRVGATGSFPRQLANVAGTLFFSANNGATGFELWRSDGTAAGTNLVKDISPGSESGVIGDVLVNIDGTIFFPARDGVTGLELWRSDGTADGTFRLKDIASGPSSSILFRSYLNIANVAGMLFFGASDGSSGEEVWTSDGTAEGTVKVKDIWAGTGSSLTLFPQFASGQALFTDVAGTLFCRSPDPSGVDQLWKSDGTPTGTVMMRDVATHIARAPSNLIGIGGTLFFTGFDSINGEELWKTDGTALGTALVKVTAFGASSGPRNLTRVGESIYFTVWDGAGHGLWKSDGTAAGTSLVKIISPSNPFAVKDTVDVNGTLFFTLDDGVHGADFGRVMAHPKARSW
jgi:ELWxxDGT repeat protein